MSSVAGFKVGDTVKNIHTRCVYTIVAITQDWVELEEKGEGYIYRYGSIRTKDFIPNYKRSARYTKRIQTY